MIDRPAIRRIAAAVIALAAWMGLAVQLDASIGLTGSAPAALWVMARYFTIIVNLLVAVLFSGLAFNASWSARPARIGGVTIAIMLVGVVHFLLLRGLVAERRRVAGRSDHAPSRTDSGGAVLAAAWPEGWSCPE